MKKDSGHKSFADIEYEAQDANTTEAVCIAFLEELRKLGVAHRDDGWNMIAFKEQSAWVSGKYSRPIE